MLSNYEFFECFVKIVVEKNFIFLSKNKIGKNQILDDFTYKFDDIKTKFHNLCIKL